MIIPEGFGHVVMGFTGQGLPLGAAITFGIDHTIGPDNPSAAALAVAQAWDACGIEAALSNTTALTSTLVKYGPSETGPSAVNGTVVGNDNVAQQSPPMVSVLVSKNTSFGGRSGKGRFYIPGLPETIVNAAGVIDGAQVAILQTAMNNFFDELGTRNVPMVVLHREGAPITAPTIVNSLTVSSQVATQRRRNRR